MYAFLRWIGGIAVHWFYGAVRVEGIERIPRRGPLLVAMNHQNALVDALIAWLVVPRPLRLTAKATLGNSLPGRLMLRLVGIIPLRRAADERTRGAVDPSRNRSSFQRIVDELCDDGAVLLFPEGVSHNEGTMVPLKTGLARAALAARDTGVRGTEIVPIGVSFEDKATPGSAVLVRVGDPIAVDAWSGDISALTRSVAERLAAVSFLPVPHGTGEAAQERARPSALVRLAAWWGRVVNRVPVTLARRLACRQSRDPGEPAMYTIVYGAGLVLAAYVVQAVVVAMLLGVAAALLYFAVLVLGAYWTAYAPHVARSSIARS